MAYLNMSSISSKVKAFSETKKGQKLMNDALTKRGSALSGGGSVSGTEKDMLSAANTLLSLIRDEAASYSLPASVMQHFDNMKVGKVIKRKDGSMEVSISLGGNLHRDSLYRDKYDGIDNIVALLNNGYGTDGSSLSTRPFGEWVGHETKDGYDYVYGRETIPGYGFMNKAVQTFNRSYGESFNVTATLSDDYRLSGKS